MSQPHAAERWARVDRLFDRVLALPMTDRVAYVQRQTTDDPRLRDEVLALLEQVATRGDLLDRPATDAYACTRAMPELLPGHRIGAYRVLDLLGRGGMGEVYRAERADGQFEQRVALKLLRHDAVEHLGLFVSERRILATLEHPGIARLYDAGVDADGRPYMVMELVEGVPITDWCRQHRASLSQRLALFDGICAAVAYAHQHLVIHRDLKPANILVTAQGQVKLLDFGVAKLLSGAVEDATRNTPLTLAYAAPEQLTHAAMSTATDVYALGMLLFELLCDRLPWGPGHRPVALAIDSVLNANAPRMSTFARTLAASPVGPSDLAGDLDAIVARALRKTPADRYMTVTALQADLRRHVHREPVAARGGARMYVFGRFMRRYRFAVAATAVVIVALAAGLAGTLWQAQRAEQQARLASAARDFMMGLFAAQDPQRAGDRPRSELTVRQLLDAGVARIGRDYRTQPDVQIELLGTASRIYNSLGADAQLEAVQQRRATLARRTFGATHPIVIEQLINDAHTACVRLQYDRSAQLLAESDRLLTAARLDRSELRAVWWQTQARLLGRDTALRPQRTQALERARSLYAQVAPRRDGHAAVLSMMANDVSNAGDPAGAIELFEQAIAVATSATDRSDGHLAEYLFNLARADEEVGRFDAAVDAYSRAEQRALRTYGPRHSSYFMPRIYHARLLHMRGDAKAAAPIFAEALGRIPADYRKNNYASWAREVFGERLAAEGRPQDALPLLQAAYDRNLTRPQNDYDVRESRRKLGDALDRMGRADEARALLQASRDEYIAKEGATSRFTLVSRERWARFLLDHARAGDADFLAAESEFEAIRAAAPGKATLEGALALAGLARIASARSRPADALALSAQAIATLDAVHQLYDRRLQAQVWVARSEALLAAGDRASALAIARRAADASRRYDARGATSIARAEMAVRDASVLTARR